MSNITACIFNYNENQNAERWYNILSTCMYVKVLDSGSNPKYKGKGAINLPNIYYSGLINKAYSIAKNNNSEWLLLVCSDVLINYLDINSLLKRINSISNSTNVGTYQPSCSKKGRAMNVSRNHNTGRLRHEHWQEGWFHLVRLDILNEFVPVDVSINKFGYGIDLMIGYKCLEKNMLCVVDDTISVIHKKGTGYNRKEADEQMYNWLKTFKNFSNPMNKPLLKKECNIKYK